MRGGWALVGARPLCLVFLAFQRDYRDLAGGPLLVIGELRIELRLFGEEPVSLLTSEDGSVGLVGLRPDLNGDFRVGYQITVPVRVGHFQFRLPVPNVSSWLPTRHSEPASLESPACQPHCPRVECPRECP